MAELENDAQTLHRARNTVELARLLRKQGDGDSFMESIKAYRPRPNDVVIAPFSKCGTTWLQQSFHCLRTRGDMDFDDISRVVPWIENSRQLGIDLDAPQRAEPRGFKTRLGYNMVPKGARYVVSLRDPKDALVSLFKFMEGWFIEPGAITIADFAQPLLAQPNGPGSYWDHLLSWWAERDNPSVMLTSYEFMTEQPAASVRRLAEFCGIPLDDALLALTLDHSSLAFMLRHKDHFDDLMMREYTEERCNLPVGGDSAKVRQGKVGGHATELPTSVAADMDAIWTRLVTPKTGFADYAALQGALGGTAPG